MLSLLIFIVSLFNRLEAEANLKAASSSVSSKSRKLDPCTVHVIVHVIVHVRNNKMKTSISQHVHNYVLDHGSVNAIIAILTIFQCVKADNEKDNMKSSTDDTEVGVASTKEELKIVDSSVLADFWRQNSNVLPNGTPQPASRVILPPIVPKALSSEPVGSNDASAKTLLETKESTNLPAINMPPLMKEDQIPPIQVNPSVFEEIEKFKQQQKQQKQQKDKSIDLGVKDTPASVVMPGLNDVEENPPLRPETQVAIIGASTQEAPSELELNKPVSTVHVHLKN